LIGLIFIFIATISCVKHDKNIEETILQRSFIELPEEDIDLDDLPEDSDTGV
tara:strand:- start:367 stop:522 length:156 start_codon:yes stop_codon:yes gene_type:complete